MPELPEQMYCSEQICIPPAFPYLLRQFAKAAIRTQPTDLLKWALAYFRCLSLNIPPPVKPRLEYPIPRDHFGITPGWLKALMYQLQNNLTISFKILWDRWTGACLEHQTLIQILCLGGFTDPFNIPWLRFVALCAAHLTDDLTHSMILICEIMTEEPEGGSAMITLETFTDLYRFLANIDASNPQVLKNMYFTDALLSLWGEEAPKEAPKEVVEEVVAEEEREAVSQETVAGEEQPVGGEEDKAKDEEAEGKEEGEAEEEVAPEEPKAEAADAEGSVKDEAEGEELSKKGSGEMDETKEEGGDEPGDEKEPGSQHTVESQTYTSVDTIIEEPRKIEPDRYSDEKLLNEDLERLKSLQEAIAGETDEELEKYKCKLIAEMPLTKSQEEALAQYAVETPTSEEMSKGEEMEGEGKEEYEDVYVDAIPGIGPPVPEELVKAVCDYMANVSIVQHGMVMPRNIRHYNCPPLEVLQY